MNLVSRLIESVDKSRRRIVVLGDAMVDKWVTGHIEDCQDDCQKLTSNSVCSTPGGAANAVECLRHWHINTDLFTYPGRFWPEKHRFVVDGRIVYRWDREVKPAEADYKLGEWKYDVNRALEMVWCASAVLLSDYDKGFLTYDLLGKVIDICKDKRIPCVADCKRTPTTYLDVGVILKYNSDYAKRWQGKLRRWPRDLCVRTNGAASPSIAYKKLRLSLPEVECHNHVGAGDCFAVHLTLALGYGYSLKEAAEIAHSAGRVYVQYFPNRPPHPCEIEQDAKGSCVKSVSA